MDADDIKLWIQKVLSSRPGYLLKKKLACVGLFQAHLEEPVKQVLLQTNTDVAVIHGGLISILQPLDVCLNKPFKERLQDRWMTWMLKGEKSLTPTGNVKGTFLDNCDSLGFRGMAWSSRRDGRTI